MTQDEIIRMAEEADDYADSVIQMPGEYHPDWHTVRDKHFAAIVAEAKDKEIAAMQAKIDGLMLEFCPQEMTPEQVANWEAHQQPWSDK